MLASSSEQSAHSAAQIRAARWATRAQFLVFGGLGGLWGVHVPSVKSHHGLDAAALSWVLLALALGAVLCLIQAGRVIAQVGARAAALVSGAVMAAALAAVLVPGDLATLMAVAAVLGAGIAQFDVAINAEGSELEAISGKKVMSGFHGMFSLGGMAGAGLGALAIRAAVPPSLQLAAAGAAVAAAVAVACAFMLPVRPAGRVAVSGYRLPRGALAVLGGLAAVGLLAEGAIYDWSVLYLQEDVGAAPAVAALGFASFSAAMAATRFAGDALRTHISAPRLLAGSGWLAAAGMALVLWTRQPAVALIGLAVVGIGFANVVPILFMAASRVPGVAAADGIAAVSSIGYVGMVIGPPLVGGIAHLSSLGWGLGVIMVGGLMLALGARRLPH